MFARLYADPVGGVTEYLTPVSVKAPYSATRAANTIVHELLQSSTTRITYLPTSSRSGTYAAVFADQQAASAALHWFTGPYLYQYTPINAPAAETLFVVTGTLELRQNLDSSWEISIPYREVIE